jgi:hypothetical protein
MVCLNIAILSLFYTAFGAFLSYLLKLVFYKYDEQWETYSLYFKVTEVSTQIIIIGVIAYWSMFLIEKAPPIFPVSKAFDKSVDTYISGMFFIYAIFLFFDHLSNKIKHIYTHSHNLFLRKMEKKQNTVKLHQDGL